MAYRLRYDSDADVLLVMLEEKGKLSRAEVGDVVLHVDSKNNPLFLEVLNASKVVPMMVKAMAKGEVTVRAQN